MANIQVKLRRGTEAEHDTTNGGFIGAEGEVTVDTTNDTLRVHDGTTAGGHELRRKDDTIAGSEIDDNAVTSGKISSTDDTFKVDTESVVVNEGGADVDFRVEGDTDTNLLLCDAENDRVIIGGTSPTESAKFAVLGNGSSVVASIENAAGSGLSVLVVKGPNPIIQWEDSAGTNNATFNVGVDDNIFYLDDVTGTAVRAFSIKTVSSTSVLNLPNIPTSATGLSSGDVWNNSGVLNIVS
jgi:hypothetical protein